MKSLEFFAFTLFACCHFNTSTVSGEENVQTGTAAQLHNYTSSEAVNKSQGESETSRHALKSAAGLQFDEKYKSLLTGDSYANVDLLNDSAEVEDGLNSDARGVLGSSPTDSRFDEFLLPEMKEKPADPSQKFKKNFKNVYKVPKKTQPSVRSFSHASLNNNPVINDFNPEKLISSANGNETSFHDFTNLYDHYLWDTTSMSSVSQACLREMSVYLRALRNAEDWALKASDASGR